MINNLKPTEPAQMNWLAPDEPQNSGMDQIRMRITMRPHVWRPSTDVYETDRGIIVRVEIAGMRDADFNITLEDRTLVIRGNRPDTPDRKLYQQMEVLFGDFMTEVALPCPVVVSQIEAVYRDGFLKVVLPKAAPRSVEIKG